MRTLSRFSNLFFSCGVLLAFTNACQKTPTSLGDDPIRVGVILPLTGAQSTFGNSARQGVRLAVDEVNQNGGISGRKLELIIVDDHSIKEDAVSIATRLINQEKVVAIIGEISSSRSLAIATIAQQYRVPMISPGSTSPKLTQVGDHIFRVCYTDTFQGKAMARFAVDQLKLKRIVIFSDTSSESSIGLDSIFDEVFRSSGGLIVGRMNYKSGEKEFLNELEKIVALKPEAVYLPGSYTEVGLIVQKLRQMGFQGRFLGGDDWDSPKLIEIAGTTIENSYFSNHFSESDPSATVQEFIRKYKLKYGAIPDGVSVLSFDSVGMLAQALKEANRTNARIQKALTAVRDFPGISGKISIDANRNVSKPVVIVKVLNRRFIFETLMSPN